MENKRNINKLKGKKMRYKSVFLVNFYYPESGYGERLYYPPLSTGYLSEYLETHGIQTRVLDMGAGYKMEKAEELMFEEIERFNPELIGISLNAICLGRSMETLNKVHNKYPGIPIIVGGPSASSKGLELLKKHSFLNYVIVREGEKPFYQLCSGEKFEKIAGLSWKKGDTLHQNSDIPTQDLSEFPFPKYKRFQLNLYGRPDTIGILTSRGCPYRCIFCQESALLGKKWRGRKPESIIEEISYWKAKGKRKVHILDDNFALDRQRVLGLSKLIFANGLDDMEYTLVAGLRIDQTNKETLLALKRMGVKMLSFGVESGSDKVLRFMRKGFTVKRADQAIALATSLGFEVRLFFIIGFPIETMKDVQKSFDLALKHPIASARFFNLIPYPDTPLMSWLEEHNAHFFYKYDEYMNDFKRFQRIPLFEYPEGMSREERLKALSVADEVIKIIENKYKNHVQQTKKVNLIK